jgi:sec-independent protein translocase protein TatA
MFGMGMGEMVVIGLIALLLFGARLPQVAKNLGQSVVSFKKGLRETQDEVDKALEEKK